MRKLALDDDILLNIEKPARYIGHEVNSVVKDKNAVEIRFAMCFPEVYEVGMSIWESRFCTICSTAGRIPGARESTLHGSIWTRSCVKNISRSLPWNLRIR